MPIIGNDDGFYNNKSIGRIGQQQVSQITPTFVRKGKATSVSAIGDVSRSSIGTYEVDGETFSAGDINIEMKRTIDRNFCVSKENLVVVHHALHKLGLAGKDVQLCTGMPFAYFYNAGTAEPNYELIEEKKSLFKSEVSCVGDEVQPVNITDHMIMAQGEAAYYDAVIDIDIKRKSNGLQYKLNSNDEILSSKVLMLDIGGGSTDPVLLEKDGVVNPDRSGSVEYAGYKLLELAENMMKSKLRYSDSLPRERYEEALRTGTLKFNKSYSEDVSNHIQSVLDEHFSELMKKVANVVGSTRDIDYVIPMGGTSLFYRETVAKHLSKNTVLSLNNPIEGNANGMFKRLYVELQKR